MKRKSFLIITPILLVIVAIFFFGISFYKNSYSNFVEDGYVISTNADNKYYFSSNNKYKINESNGNVEFDDNNSETIRVDEASFVHYVNGSIATFKKSVILDLDKLNEDSYHYYNFFPESVFSKVNSGYSVSYLDNHLTMNNFLLKISEDKYMVVSDNLEVNLSDTKKQLKDNYLEITYLDGNIIKLDNQELSIKNISSSLVLNVGEDVKIDLINKKVTYKGEDKVNLGEITINSDDNIDIVSEDKNKVIESEEDENNETPQRKLPKFDEVADGLVEVENELIEKVVEENAAIKDAEFLIQDLTVTANAVKAFIQINDPAGVLSGDRIIKIIESDTNNVVYYVQETSGRANITIDYEKLKPQTNYTLVVNQDYVKNDVTYNRDFVQKAIVSAPLGVEVTKNYAKTDELSFKINKDVNSSVTRVSYKLYDKLSYLITSEDTPIESGDVDLTESNIVTFNNLRNDSVYTLVVSDFVYDNIVLQGGETISTELKTLKRRPTVDKTSFSIDKLNSKFVLHLNNVKDEDYGVLSYHVDVYDGDNLVVSKSSNYNDQIEINVDDNLIQRYTDYRAYVYLVFNDNEKEYEIPLGNEIMNMNSKKAPVVLNFEEEKITFERIKGRIVIEDEESLIDYSKNMSLTYRSLSVGTGLKISNDYNVVQLSDKKAVLNIDVNNLRSNESYLFVLSAYIDYKDGNGYVYSDIGSVMINTKEPNKMTVEYSNIATSSDIFRVRAKLMSYDSSESTELEASTMEQLTIRLHKADSYNCSEIATKNYNCWTSTKYDGNKDNYQSELKEGYYDSFFEITPELLNINTNDLTYGLYKIEVFDAKDYTTDKNDLPIVAEAFPVVANNVSGHYIDKNEPYKVTPIQNNGKYEELLNDTVIGYKVTPKVLVDAAELNDTLRITYHVYNALSRQEVFTKTVDNTDPIDLFFGEDGASYYKRGSSYYFKYDFAITVKDENGEDVEFLETSKSLGYFYPERQTPIFDLYLAKRDANSTLTWNYKLSDVDHALKDSKLYYFKGYFESASNKESITLTADNKEHSFTLENMSGKALNIFREIALNDDLELKKVFDVDKMVFESRANIQYFRYEVVPQKNNVLVNLSIDDKYKKFVVKADVTVKSNYGNSVILKDLQVSSKGEVLIDYYDIKSLMGKGDLSVDVKLYYDNGLIDVKDYGKENVIYSSNSAYFVDSNYGKLRTYNLTSFDADKKTIGIKYGNIVANYNIKFDNGYLISDDIKINKKAFDFLIKQVSNVDGTCNENCSFNFDAINPTFALNEKIVGLTYANLKPKIDNVDQEIKDRITVKLYFYNNEGTELFFDKEISLVELMENGIHVDGLTYDTSYCMMAKWIYEGQEHDFNYADDIDKFYFKTVDSVGVNKQEATYAANYNGRRNIKLSYNVELLDGYDGITYKIFNSSGTDITSNFDISSDLIDKISANNGYIERYIDISYKLSTNDDYYIQIIPYYTNNGNTTYLSSTDIPFHLVISKPLVDIIKTTGDSNDETLNFRVLVTDTYNALFEKKTYKLYIKDMDKTYDNQYGQLIDDGYSTNNIYNISRTCESKKCQIYLVYEFNTSNSDENYEVGVYSKSLIISDDSYLGDPIVVNTDSSKVKLAFAEYWNINSIAFLKYTVTTKTGEYYTSDEINPLVFTIDQDTNHAYINLVTNDGKDLQLQTGEYNIQMQFYWLDKNTNKYRVIDKNVDYIKK